MIKLEIAPTTALFLGAIGAVLTRAPFGFLRAVGSDLEWMTEGAAGRYPGGRVIHVVPVAVTVQGRGEIAYRS